MDENNLNNKIEKNKKENENCKKTSLMYKILISIFTISLLISGVFILFTNYKNKDKEEVKVVPLSEFNIDNNEIFNVNKNIKKGLSVVDIGGDGGRISFLNGSYINYSYHSDTQILIELYSNNNSSIFKTMIESKDYQDIDIYDAYLSIDNKLLLSVPGMNKKNKICTTLMTFNMNGDILSEFTTEDTAYISYSDSEHGIVVSILDEYYNYNKIIKFNNQNKKVFEYVFEEEIYRVFADKNKTIVFTCSYENKESGVTLHIIDENGKEIFSENNKEFNGDTLENIIQLSDGNFMIQEMKYINQKNYDGCRLSSIVKIDSEFKEIWRKNINKSYNFLDTIELNNEYYIYMQEIYSREEETSETKINSFTKIDASGNIVWCKYFGYDKNNEFNIINDNFINMDIPIYIKDEKTFFKGSVFEDSASDSYVIISVDASGNIS